MERDLRYNNSEKCYFSHLCDLSFDCGQNKEFGMNIAIIQNHVNEVPVFTTYETLHEDRVIRDKSG